MDHIRSFKKGEKKMARKRKRSRKRVRHNAPTKRRRISRKRHRSNSPTHRGRRYGRRYRRNPRMPRTAMGFVTMVTNGAIDAGEVVVGKALTRLVPQTFGLPRDGAMGLGVQVLSAIFIGWVGTFISGNASKMMLAGGLSAPVEDFLKSMNIPIIGPALGEDVVEISAYPQMLADAGAYPQSPGELGDVYDMQEVYSQQ